MSTMGCPIIRKKIPHFVRNDASTHENPGVVIGGGAADSDSPLSLNACHSEQCEESLIHL